MTREPGKRSRPWRERDTRRRTSAERGYTSRWQTHSKHYRRRHPLCVPCLMAGRVRASQCVDHIVPNHSCPELFWLEENWAAMCTRCHSIKTAKEPQQVWTPRHDRIVVCGLPGTGKTTFARESGAPYWDADEWRAFGSIEAVRHLRDKWIRAHFGACVVVVQSITEASQLAAQLEGIVKHMTDRFVERPSRFRAAPE